MQRHGLLCRSVQVLGRCCNLGENLLERYQQRVDFHERYKNNIQYKILVPVSITNLVVCFTISKLYVQSKSCIILSFMLSTSSDPAVGVWMGGQRLGEGAEHWGEPRMGISCWQVSTLKVGSSLAVSALLRAHLCAISKPGPCTGGGTESNA